MTNTNHKMTITIENRPVEILGKTVDRWFATDNPYTFFQKFEYAKEYYEELYSDVSNLTIIKAK